MPTPSAPATAPTQASNAASAGSGTQAAGQTSRLHRRLWRWHFYAAFLVVPFVLLQSATGVLYLWQDAWADWIHPQLRFVDDSRAPVPLEQQLQAALAAHPQAVPSLMRVQADPTRSTQVMFADARGMPFPVFVDPGSGTVMGELSPWQWMPGWTRLLHGGWPINPLGSWLLELGACWAVVMILTGLYLWWPRDRSPWRALVPRFGLGMRTLLIDLHGAVAVLFSGFLLLFLLTALPWTDFWGQRVLQPIQVLSDQRSPFGDVFGARSTPRADLDSLTIDALVARARSAGLQGALDISLGQQAQSPRIVRDLVPRSADRSALAFDRYTGETLVETRWEDYPWLPRVVATGVDLHEGRLFGTANRWMNTALAVALLWLSLTGLASWWLRRPRRRLGAPAALGGTVPRGLRIGAAGLCLLMPLLGLSVVSLWLLDRGLKRT